MSQLHGIKVVDFSRYLSGPTVTMLLGDLGADVIKVEGLPSGDPSRSSGPFDDDQSVYFLASNRNKRSLAVDLRSSEGKALCMEVLSTADVLVQNFRPGVIDAMGFGYEALRAVNPRLIHCNISGFGWDPPGADFPGFDQTAQAMSGLMSVTGTEATGPLRVGIAVGDSVTGVFAAVGVLAALHQRNVTGAGQRVDTTLMESALTLMSYQAQKFLSLGEVPGQDGNDHPIMFPQGTFATGDGTITLASGNEPMWRRLCAVLGIEQLAEDPRYATNADRMARRVELRSILEDRLSARSTAEWIEIINEAGVPASPVLDVRQALEHPFSRQLSMVQHIDHSSLGDMKVLGKVVKGSHHDENWLRLAPPVLGEHSVEVCEELGMDAVTIADLTERGVIRDGRVAGSTVATGSR